MRDRLQRFLWLQVFSTYWTTDWFAQKQSHSWGPIPWLYPPEIMPLTVRAKGVSLSTATNWFFNFIVGLVTPYLQEVIEWRLYPMHGFFCVCSFIVVYFRRYHSFSAVNPNLTT